MTVHVSSTALIHIAVLEKEIECLKQLLQETETGHIHTTINTLKWRVDMIKEGKIQI